MAYRVVKNRRTGRPGLEFYSTTIGTSLGKRGMPRRRIIVRNGRDYHVTKGWRSE